MVESATAKSSAMARLLSCEYRWAVSGTPLGKGKLSDLQGLLSFLGVGPWVEKAWWTHAIEAPLVVEATREADAAVEALIEALPGLRRADLSLATSGEGLSGKQLRDEKLRLRLAFWLGKTVIYIYIYIHMCMCVCMYVYMYTYIYIYTCMHIYMFRYLYILLARGCLARS